MDYTEQNFLGDLEKMSFDELCLLANIDLEEARIQNYSTQSIVKSISNLFSMVS